jgi:hypothetical protein
LQGDEMSALAQSRTGTPPSAPMLEAELVELSLATTTRPDPLRAYVADVQAALADVAPAVGG